MYKNEYLAIFRCRGAGGERNACHANAGYSHCKRTAKSLALAEIHNCLSMKHGHTCTVCALQMSLDQLFLFPCCSVHGAGHTLPLTKSLVIKLSGFKLH